MIAASITPKPIKSSQFVSDWAAFKVTTSITKLHGLITTELICAKIQTATRKRALRNRRKEGKKESRQTGDLGKTHH